MRLYRSSKWSAKRHWREVEDVAPSVRRWRGSASDSDCEKRRHAGRMAAEMNAAWSQTGLSDDAGHSDTRICTGRLPSSGTNVGPRPSPCACHDFTPRIGLWAFALWLCFLSVSWRLKTLIAPLNELTEVDPWFFITLTASVFWKRVHANQSRSHPPMSVTWNLVSERARRIPGRVFQDTQAMWARNEIHKCGGKRKHNLGSCCANATLSFYPTCWSRAQFRR